MSQGFTITEETSDREYFTIVPNYIINHSTIWERDLYLTMKRIAGEGGSCYASHQTIADKTGVSRPTISKTVQKLLKRGWIKEAGKVAGKTHPTKNYIIVDLWQFNSAYYKQQKIRKPQNQSIPEENPDTSTTEPKIRKPRLHKEEPIKEEYNYYLRNNDENSSLRVSKSFGKQEINHILKVFTEVTGLEKPSDKKPRWAAQSFLRNKDRCVDDFEPAIKFLYEQKGYALTSIGAVNRHYSEFKRDIKGEQSKNLTDEQKELKLLFGKDKL